MNFLNFQRMNNKDADQTEDVQAGLFPFFVVTCMMFVFFFTKSLLTQILEIW